jgi:hypothetical protein
MQLKVPFFSVIIPTYNRADLLREALDSLFAQTFTDYEVIVVDDGSTDDTANFLSTLGDRVRVFRQKNQGPGAARNLGIANARGEFVAFLDSDDLWCPWALEVYAQVIADNRNVSFVAGHGEPLEKKANLLDHPPQRTFKPSRDFLTASKAGYAFGGTPGMAVKSELLRAVGGFVDEFINGEDQDLCLRLGTAPGFVRIQSPPLFLQRTNDVHVSCDLGKSLGGINLLLGRERAGAYPGGPAENKVRRQIICAAVRSVSLVCAQDGRTSEALRLYRESFCWQLTLGRWKYLAGLPFVALTEAVRPRQT